MPPDELIQLVGPYIAYLLFGLASLLAILKMLIPKAFDAMVGRLQSQEAERVKGREHTRSLEVEARGAERQEERAILTQMLTLQTNIIKQNEALLAWVTQKVGDDLQGFAQESQARCAEAKVWGEKASRELIQNRSQLQLVQMELSRVADAVQTQTERFASVMAFYEAQRHE